MVYVDPLQDFGWVLRGHRVENCHLFTDLLDLEELHLVAQRIGMRRSWFQGDSRVAPHYDLTASRRVLAVGAGAIELSKRDAVAVWRARRLLVASAAAVAIDGLQRLTEGVECPR